ncbi:unnamed protein product [Lasius platythorax]|uniref:Uncharacterized protein n=1 Tax=Lasius platythorax TaxID=488582 RepID=A0AAV2N6M3_9HYME
MRRKYENERDVVTRVLLIKVTVYIKVLIHRARGRANGNVKHSQREAPVLVTQQSGIKVLQVFQKRNFQEGSSAKSRRRPSGQRELSIGSAYTVTGSRYLAQFVTYINETQCI